MEEVISENVLVEPIKRFMNEARPSVEVAIAKLSPIFPIPDLGKRDPYAYNRYKTRRGRAHYR